MHYVFTPRGVCSTRIDFDIDKENRITNLLFTGGCNGNLKAIARLVDGKSADEIFTTLAGNDCRGRGTSCADQLAKAVMEAKEANNG